MKLYVVFRQNLFFLKNYEELMRQNKKYYCVFDNKLLALSFDKQEIINTIKNDVTQYKDDILTKMIVAKDDNIEFSTYSYSVFYYNIGENKIERLYSKEYYDIKKSIILTKNQKAIPNFIDINDIDSILCENLKDYE